MTRGEECTLSQFYNVLDPLLHHPRFNNDAERLKFYDALFHQFEVDKENTIVQR